MNKIEELIKAAASNGTIPIRVQVPEDVEGITEETMDLVKSTLLAPSQEAEQHYLEGIRELQTSLIAAGYALATMNKSIWDKLMSKNKMQLHPKAAVQQAFHIAYRMEAGAEAIPKQMLVQQSLMVKQFEDDIDYWRGNLSSRLSALNHRGLIERLSPQALAIQKALIMESQDHAWKRLIRTRTAEWAVTAEIWGMLADGRTTAQWRTAKNACVLCRRQAGRSIKLQAMPGPDTEGDWIIMWPGKSTLWAKKKLLAIPYHWYCACDIEPLKLEKPKGKTKFVLKRGG